LTATIATWIKPEDVPTLKLLAVGAEAVPQQLITTWGTKLRLLNIYGPTETTVTCICHEVRNRIVNSSVIGQPFGQNRTFILDKNLAVVPYGSVGELCIAGPQLAVGYLGDEEKTKKVFVKHPFSANDELIYRTGDLARFIQDGNIELLGRKDTQVKLNGLRIEIREVETAILNSGEAVHVAVHLLNIDSHKRLVAWIVLPEVIEYPVRVLDDQYITTIQTRVHNIGDHLKNVLPAYMIPHRWVPISQIPYNSSGKTDYRKLEELMNGMSNAKFAEFKNTSATLLSKDKAFLESVYPQSITEAILQQLWAKLLNVKPYDISRDDSILNFGGDSVSIILLAQKCRQEGYELNANQMFNAPVLKDMAASMSRRDFTKVESSIEPFSLLKMVNIDINAVRNSIYSIPTDEIEDIYPASPLQEGMVALTQHDSTQYMLQHVYDLQGEIDINAFR
jgi:aryl carrier-like protein